MIKTLSILAVSMVLYAFAAPAPSIRFDKTLHDFGTIPQGDPVQCEFIFTNDGDAPLILTDVKASCGCTTPKWPQQPIMPGQKGTITAEYNAASDGAFSKSISVYTNVSSTTYTLTLKGVVEKTSRVLIEEEGTEIKINK
ncbi:MAG: DUF1573 domain-containing protein [Bacteroidetes bacterium]|jgi:hypothetical protein|nr:DUF1573 domain-containing protein [Bacteroidota bacterium]